MENSIETKRDDIGEIIIEREVRSLCLKLKKRVSNEEKTYKNLLQILSDKATTRKQKRMFQKWFDDICETCNYEKEDIRDDAAQFFLLDKNGERIGIAEIGQLNALEEWSKYVTEIDLSMIQEEIMEIDNVCIPVKHQTVRNLHRLFIMFVLYFRQKRKSYGITLLKPNIFYALEGLGFAKKAGSSFSLKGEDVIPSIIGGGTYIKRMEMAVKELIKENEGTASYCMDGIKQDL